MLLLVYQTAATQQFNRELKGAGPVETTRVNTEGDKAYLRVTSDVQGLRFESNRTILSVNAIGSGDWEIWLPPGTHLLKIGAEGFRLLELPAYTFSRRKSYELAIQPQTSPLLTIPISVLTDPPGARLRIDGEDKGYLPIQEVTPGRHEVTLELHGFRTLTTSIDVSRENVLFQFKLEAVEPLSVEIASQPTGARIMLDGAEKGETDRGLFLLPGEYSLRLARSGYVGVDTMIDVREKTQNKFRFVLEKNFSLLDLEVYPPTSRVLLNREDFSMRKVIDLAPGRYMIEISSPGYSDTSETIELIRGRPTKKLYRLRPLKGTVLFSVQPIQTSVLLKKGGETLDAWEGVKQLRDIPVGEYEIHASAVGFLPETRRFRVTEGKSTVLDVVLRKEPLHSKGRKATTRSMISDMILVEGGTFHMGDESGRPDERPVHFVTLSSFYIDTHEVTVAQFRQFCQETGRPFPSPPPWDWKDNHPVVNVSWNDAVAYAHWAGKRLPTEAEWEYAARGGALMGRKPYSGSDSVAAVAWYAGNSELQSQPVGMKVPNELGVYDMSGNAWEWCSDWSANYNASAQTNPMGPAAGNGRVIRGGSWFGSANTCRVSYRGNNLPDDANFILGFRCARDY